MSFLKILGWSIAGAVLGCALTYAGIMGFFWFQTPPVDGDTRGFEELGATMMSIGGAGVGLLIGAVIGTVRWWGRRSVVVSR